ncbi:MAG: LamG domain-containing protein [Bdellovibrionales bacterium]|nr:LamG domain-containing protein [Bdellovibrionales bacterium]
MKKNKFIFIILVLILTLAALIQGCAQKENKLIPKDANAIFDAENMLGLNSIPTTGCTTTSWVNLVNSAFNGAFTCINGNSGFEGNGSTTLPYKVTFNGSGTYVSTNIDQQPTNQESVTWIIWVYPTDLTLATQSLLSIDDHNGAYNRALLINNGMFTVYNGVGSFSPVAATLNTWQQIVVTFTPSSITLYKNNQAFPMGFAPVIKNTAQTLQIGKSGAGSFDFFKGSIAWIGLFNRALTAKEIKDSCTSLVNKFAGAACSN